MDSRCSWQSHSKRMGADVGIKVRSLRISISDRPATCSGKDSAEKHLILLDLSKTKMVSCSGMRTFLAAGKSISTIF